MITLENISLLQTEFSVIHKRYVTGNNSKPRYQLLNDLNVVLSNGDELTIPKGFIWDLSSVPRFLWWLLPPDGDFGIAYIIHDYLWIHRQGYTRKYTDDEMLRWAMAVNGSTIRKRLDNYARYLGVRAFGWLVWRGFINI